MTQQKQKKSFCLKIKKEIQGYLDENERQGNKIFIFFFVLY